MGREEEELRFRSAEDQQERWRGQVSGGVKKQNSAPLAPQLSLNAPAEEGTGSEDAAAPVQQVAASAPRVRFHPDTVAPPPPHMTIDSRPLLILTCVAAAACIGGLMTRDAGSSPMSRITGGQEYALSRQQMNSLFDRM